MRRHPWRAAPGEERKINSSVGKRGRRWYKAHALIGPGRHLIDSTILGALVRFESQSVLTVFCRSAVCEVAEVAEVG